MNIINDYPHAELSNLTRERLMTASTASLHTLLHKRGLKNTYIQGVGRMNDSQVKMVGQAYTLRYIPAREDLDVVAAFRDPEHPSAWRWKAYRRGACWCPTVARTRAPPAPGASC